MKKEVAMNDLAKHVGSKIRFLRKQKNYSLTDFSKLINKSAATLSKYENGSIVIDIETLFEISTILDVDMSSFTDDYAPLPRKSRVLPAKTIFGGGDVLYMYIFDGKSNTVEKSLIKVRYNDTLRIFEAELFLDIDSYDTYHNCVRYYTGEFKPFDLISSFVFVNQTNSIEQVMINISNPLDNATMAMGLLTGISSYTHVPVAMKTILSRNPLSDSAEICARLSFSKEDLRSIKK
jgi:transcriptional regulator with XRE-family HTH domain